MTAFVGDPDRQKALGATTVVQPVPPPPLPVAAEKLQKLQTKTQTIGVRG